jgi:hypothetical protein
MVYIIMLRIVAQWKFGPHNYKYVEILSILSVKRSHHDFRQAIPHRYNTVIEETGWLNADWEEGQNSAYIYKGQCNGL